jgi:hypothetical protein
MKLHAVMSWALLELFMIISRTGHDDLFLALLESDQRIDFHYQKPVSELVAPSPLLAETFSTNRWIQSRLLVVKELCRRGITDPEVP